MLTFPVLVLLVSVVVALESCQGPNNPVVLSGSSGSLATPGHSQGGNYENNMNCAWRIQGNGQTVRLHFVSFALEAQSSCSYDKLSIYDANDASSGSPSVALCGSQTPSDFVSSGSSVYLTFTTDYSIVRSGFEITYTAVSVGVLNPPPTEPESAYDCVCSAAADTLTTYDGTALKIPFGAEAKQLASRWAADGRDPCKYQLRVITENAAVSWVSFSVGVHKNKNKYWRNFAFNRYQRGGVDMKGWKMSGAQDLTLPYNWEGDATAVSIYNTDDGGFLLNSTTCPYELRYNKQASGSESVFQLSVSGAKYQATSDDLRGWCQNCNSDASDDVRRCDTLADVSGATDMYTQIADSCHEDDKSLITI